MVRVSPPSEQGEAANPEGSWWSTLCWLRCGDICGCRQRAMPEQELNLADVGALFQQVTGEGVATVMF